MHVTCRAAAVGVLGLLWVITAVFTCPEKCGCAGRWTRCGAMGFKDVPSNIPLETTNLDLAFNSIQNLTEAAFSRLTSLKELYLQNNDIRVLPDGVFSNLTSLKRLYLHSNDIRVLPDGVFSNLSSLKRLYLQNNDIRVLPDEVFSHLTRLKRLYLQNNDIRVLPDGVFSNLSSLKRLYLQNNDIRVLPDEVFSHLTSLKRLYLQNNDIRVLPDEVFSHLTSLKKLDLQSNDIRVLPDGVFSHLTSLKQLYLQDNDIRVLPDGVFSNLTSLKGLYLQNNDIRVLPDEVFSHLTRLKWLHLQNNNIRVLPDEVFSHITSLNELYLQNNNIRVLPDGVFSRLTSLKWLDLQNNNIRVLPDGVFSRLTSLKWLDLQNNNISVLPDEVFSHLTSLYWLHLQNNNIRVLPDEVFSHLTSLKGLYLKNNNISVLPDEVFSHLTSLERLHLQNNNIRVLPDGVFSHLTNLNELHLQNNDIRVLPDGVFSHLTNLNELHLQNNDIRVLPDGVFSHLTSLYWLDLQNNNIRVLPDEVFSHVTSLEWLHLKNNNIRVLPDEVFSHLTSLYWLDLQNNNIRVLHDEVFSHVTSLEWLHLQNNDIRVLPDEVFSHLTSLVGLFLWNNNISVIPDGVFSHLTSLEWLHLQNNNISVLPDEVFSHLTRLKWLHLQNNNIRVLPDEVFSHITSLKELDLQNNNIRVLPDGVFSRLTRLYSLNLSYNQIADFQKGVLSQFRNIKQLYLRDTNIQNLANESSTQTTQTVDLSNNNIKIKLNLSSNSIQTLPTDITNIRLAALAIGGNPWRCDCRLQRQMTSAHLRNAIQGNPTCSSPPHMEGVKLAHVGTSTFTVCHGHGDCTPGEDTCDCNVGWTGPYCDMEYNVARGKMATQSSTVSYDNRVQEGPEKAVDGSTDGCARTSFEFQPWWKVDLAGYYAVNRVSVPVRVSQIKKWREDGRCGDGYTTGNGRTAECDPDGIYPCCSRDKWCGNSAAHCDCADCVNYRSPGYTLMVRVGPNEDFTQNDQCGLKNTATLTGRQSFVMHCDPPLPGRYVSIQMIERKAALDLCEVEVYATDICCDETIGIANGQITANDGFCFGEKIQFFCNPGYELVGDSWTTCQKNGSWAREVPTCKRICCNNTIVISNGQVTSNDGYCSGNAVHFSCDAGYELVGSSFTICQDEGWDREFPTCQQICCNNTIVISNGQVTGNDGYCSGNAVHFSCDAGYELVGSSFTICQDEGWDREFPTCQRICCDNTTEITNGLVNATDGYCFGNDISFSCNPGYELVGTPLTTCQEDGSWGREIPTCQPHAQTVPEEQSMEATIAGASASVVAVLIVVSAVLMVLLRRRRRKRKDSTVQVSYFLPDDVIIHNRRLQELAAAPPVPDRPELPGFEVDPSRVTLGQRIGSGAFGLAYRATLTTGDETEDVVVKTLKDATSEEDRLSFLQEIRAVVALGVQDNVMGLVGCCTVVRDHLYLITEFMPYGDLKNFLRKCRQEEIYDEPLGDIYNFEVKQMYQVARQIARGMDHISRSRYIHGDLAARNVLVGEELKVKISDFGLAEDIYTRGYRRQDRLQRVPWKWMAPERLEDGKAYTSQSDVWSFGIVLYEISTLGGDPYPDVAIAHLKDRLQAGFRMRKPEGCPTGMYDLMLQCWRWQPAERPSFRNLELDLDSQLAFYGPEYARTAPATGTAPKPTA
ncbi:uncharacterized protein LOC144918542 [Branchiostoma floridae x Branchiostoma belcheri]